MMGDDFILPNNWAKIAYHPNFSPLNFAHLIGVYERQHLNQDWMFHLGRGSGQSKSTSLRLIEI